MDNPMKIVKILNSRKREKMKGKPRTFDIDKDIMTKPGYIEIRNN